jgi:hypothetical protein
MPHAARPRFHQNLSVFGKPEADGKHVLVSRTDPLFGSTIGDAPALTCANASSDTVRVDPVTQDHQDSNHYVGKTISLYPSTPV